MLSIRKGVISVFITKVLVAFIGLITVVIASRYLGAEGRGMVSFFTSSVALLQLFCDFGSSSALINLSYTYRSYILWLSAILWVLGICILGTLFLLGFTNFDFVYWVPAAAFLFSFLNINGLLLMGNQKVFQRNVLLVLQPFLLLLFFVVIFFYTNTVQAYPIAFLMALLIAGMVSYQMLLPTLRGSKKESLLGFKFEAQVIKAGFWAQSGHAIQFLNYRINFFIIVFFMGNAALGIYNNAIVIAESLWILGHSVGQIMHMKILNSTSDSEHRTITNKMLFYNFAGTFLMLMVLLLLPSTFWEWLFSKDFSGIKPLFFYMALGIICFSISNILNHYFHAKNKFKTIAICNITGLLVGVSFGIWFIPQFGLMGASMAWSSGLFASMCIYIFAYFKRNKMTDGF